MKLEKKVNLLLDRTCQLYTVQAVEFDDQSVLKGSDMVIIC